MFGMEATCILINNFAYRRNEICKTISHLFFEEQQYVKKQKKMKRKTL
jgi:hypothetical protein